MDKKRLMQLARSLGLPENSSEEIVMGSLVKQINAKNPCFSGSIRAAEADGQRAKDENGEELYELSFSSEEPYERWWGTEILGHSADEVVMDWLSSGNAPLLDQHNHNKQIGLIVSAKIEGGRGTAIVRFGKSALAQEIKADVDAGIRRNISVGYRIHEIVLVKKEDDHETYRAVKWEPFEVSIVSVPADQTVGTNRSDEAPVPQLETPIVSHVKSKENTVSEETRKKLARELGLSEDASVEAILQAQAKKSKAEGREAAQAEFRAEVARRDGIEAMAKHHPKLRADAKRFMDEGKTEREFAEFLCEKMRDGYTPLQSAADCSQGQREDMATFSVAKFLRESVEGNFTGIEAEMQQEGVSELRSARLSASGFYLPSMLVGMRSSTVTGSDTNAGNLVGEERRGFIEALEAVMWLRRMGVQFWEGLSGNIIIPRDNSAFEGENVTETGGLTVQDLDIDLVTMAPNRIGAAARFSLQLLNQSSISIDNFITSKLGGGIGKKLNKQLINGSGIGSELLGIMNLTGVNSVIMGANGAAMDWSSLVKMETVIGDADAATASMGILASNTLKGALKSTQKVDGQSEMLWADKAGQEFGELNGYNALATTLMPNNGTKGTGTDLSAMIQGVFSSLIVGSWGGVDIVMQREKYAETGEIGVVANGFYGNAFEHPESFSIADDIVTL